MTGSTTVRRARLQALLEAARAIADAANERGIRARKRLALSTGLSPEGVDFALERCLETRPTEAEIAALLRTTDEAPAAHVLLSANVFVAAHRAIAIALAASATVHVRASRREPEMAELLSEGAPAAFQLQAELAPQPGDHLWAYGSDETLRSVAHTLAPGVTLHAHGTGFGCAVIAGRPRAAELERLLAALAEDVALFDQRGCLSPRILFVTEGADFAGETARELAEQLTLIQARVPRGRIAREEAQEMTEYRDAVLYAGDVLTAGLGFVGTSAGFRLAPVGRNVHVVRTNDLFGELSRLSRFVTTCGAWGDAETLGQLAKALPQARVCELGRMQQPPFEGPVDRRDWEP